ncbi:hypothetical protein SELMODRAFT_102410 [Selaginella moellendorffii]|uniref:5-amino-6-(5-phosphoribosylamino)uracil reductase n=1 Tax=Selaginella moellendorffii TaxID=88036 RepID=D8RVG7_SELML|nr:riboflavin biosynthesis protein PYRR, chloroplastic isoform X1 [Selaginella moellendorffii]EFJ23954.1 hypothetical protein SELMODRAFT_102410 [Selaginella moellendorffii]|eukprot:XP_002975169.1 riboflavin biosynthesis protein PYRR, chloroplastic isoform X1 [Selaginella moellendorffii]
MAPSNVGFDSFHMLRAAELADGSAGHTAPHPNSACVIARSEKVVGEAFLYGQGTRCAEIQAVEMAGELSRGATAYLNLEPGDCHGDDTAIKALKQSGVARVVVGLQHPLKHHSGKAIAALRGLGIPVDVLEKHGDGTFKEAFRACQEVNAPLLYRATHEVPFSILKYAMTLDGKIAASTGHASWVSSKMSRQRVFETRGRSDAIIVGGNTVRRDNPRLTTRREGGHLPVRVVMSRTLNLPLELHLWDVSNAHTIVMTQRGARREFQRELVTRGVEVVEFDFLTPKAVMDYCYERGFLTVLWECGGALSAPALAAGIIHKVIAFVAPKIIGGVTAPTPVGELGMVEMTQALNLLDVTFEQVGPDMLVSGYLKPIPRMKSPASAYADDPSIADAGIFSSSTVIYFYKSWDPYGAFTNFTAHSIKLPGSSETWKSVEHYYQAQKFSGVEDELAMQAIENIRNAESPEEAARIGRRLARERPDLVRPDWENSKMDVMEEALVAKFSSYPQLRSLLLSTAGCVLIESSPHDYFWGSGKDGTGQNQLGRLLMKLRAAILTENQHQHIQK